MSQDVLAKHASLCDKVTMLGEMIKEQLAASCVEPTSLEEQSGGEGKSSCLNCNTVL